MQPIPDLHASSKFESFQVIPQTLVLSHRVQQQNNQGSCPAYGYVRNEYKMQSGGCGTTRNGAEGFIFQDEVAEIMSEVDLLPAPRNHCLDMRADSKFLSLHAASNVTCCN